MSRKPAHTAIALAAVMAASAAAAPGAYAQSNEGNTVEAVEAVGRAPTSVTIHVAGKGASAVRREVLVASHTVCHNAVMNREVWLVDFENCRATTLQVAMADYGRIARTYRGTASADSGLILIAVR